MRDNKGRFIIGHKEGNRFPKGNIPWNKGIKTGIKPWFGKKRSEEVRKKMSDAKIGYEPWNKGKKYSAIEGERNPSKRPEVREKIRLSKLGKKRPDMVEKSRVIMKQNWKNRLIIIPKKDSSIEVKIQNFLKQLGIEFFTHQYMHIEHGYQCDIFIPSKKLIIECDGNYWHKYPTGTDIDKVRTSELISKGFKILRLWESEIKVMELNDFKLKVGI